MSYRHLLWILLLAVAAGCAETPNPSFTLTTQHARDELKAMHGQVKPLDRPVVVIDGFLDVGIGSSSVAGELRKITNEPDRIITVNLFWCRSFDDCRKKIVSAVEKAFPNVDLNETVEIDVVGISMGGLAARFSAVPPTVAPVALADASLRLPPVEQIAAQAIKRLNIVRLFTLATPHKGATAADIPSFLLIPTQRDMRFGSSFLKELDEKLAYATYEIIPYARLRDATVGERNTAPPGRTPIWMPIGLLESGHFGVFRDPRIAADIARRLRGEPSYAVEPLAPLPG